MHNYGHEIIKEPSPEYAYDDQGRITAMYLKIRTGKAVRAVHPNKNVLVYFLLGQDDMPIGIKFLEPAPGLAITRVASYLYRGEDGKPGGMGQETKHDFIPLPNRGLL